MASFFDLGGNQLMSIDEYLRTIDSPFKRYMTEDLFRDALRLIELIRIDLFPRPDEPIVRVKFSTQIYAAGIEGMIEVSSGLVEHCLALPELLLELIVSQPDHEPDLPTKTPNPLFTWAIAHEYWHGLRRHNTALINREDSIAHAKAVEFDADLCAAASMYRWIQHDASSIYCDSTIRQMAIAALFWAIRHLPFSNGSDSHPGSFERLYHMMTKIISLSSQKGTPVNPSVMTKESEGHVNAAISAAVKTDRLYKLHNRDDTSDFRTFALEYIEKKGWRNFTQPWDELRTLVSISSGTRT